MDEKQQQILALTNVINEIIRTTILATMRGIEIDNNPYSNLLPIKTIRDGLNITCFAQVIHFFNPDREIFLPIAWSFDGSATDQEIESLKWIFPQYNIGPLYELWRSFEKDAETDPIFQIAKQMNSKSLIKMALQNLKFTAFLIVPVESCGKFLGTISIFFIKSWKVRQPKNSGKGKFIHFCDNPSQEKLEVLTQAIIHFYTNILYKLQIGFELAKVKGKPIEELGQSYR